MSTKTNEDGSVTVPLKYKLNGAEGEIGELTLKRLKGKQLRKVDLARMGDGAEMMGLIQALATIEPFIADQIDAEDFVALSEVVKGFFGQSPTTGAR